MKAAQGLRIVPARRLRGQEHNARATEARFLARGGGEG